jgi:predicted PurR-regulated permease PerM
MFFLAIALLAITVTVFVLAVSLLGRAVKLSTQEQISAEQKRKKDTETEIKKIQDRLEKAKSEEKVKVEELVKNLRDLEEKDRKHRNRIRWIKVKPKLLTATWGAIVPGALFIASAFFSTYALYYKDSVSAANSYAFFATLTLLSGIIIVALTLKVIEGVAITSEETAFTRQVEQLKAALREFEEEKRPEIVLFWRKSQPPFHIKADSTQELVFSLLLTKGEVAANVLVGFYIPPGFSFPGRRTLIQADSSRLISKYVGVRLDYSAITPGPYIADTVVFKAPSVTGEFIAYYQLSCIGFQSELKEFKIVVE